MAGNSVALALDVVAKDNASRKLRNIGDAAEKAHSHTKNLIGALAGGFIGTELVRGIAGAVSAAEESRKVGRLTEQVIKTTGGAAKLTAMQVGDLATAISNKTGVDDEAIQSGANLLLTFTNVRNEVGKGNDIFSQATATIADMSVALGQDTKASAIQLGKALNDPIRGVTALSKVGVSFTEQQKKQIKTLVESGKTLDAQKIILKELGREFGGAAEAASTPTEKLKVIMGNLEETIGAKLLPTVDRFATFAGEKAIPAITAFVDGMEAGTGPGGQFATAVGEVGDAAKTAWAVAEPLFSFLGKHPKLFTDLALGAGGVAVGLKGFSVLKGLTGSIPGVGGGAGKGGSLMGVQDVRVVNWPPGFGGPDLTPGGSGNPGKSTKLSKFGKVGAAAAAAGGLASEFAKWGFGSVPDTRKMTLEQMGITDAKLKTTKDPAGTLKWLKDVAKESDDAREALSRFAHDPAMVRALHEQAAAAAQSKAAVRDLMTGGVYPLRSAIASLPKMTRLQIQLIESQGGIGGTRATDNGGGGRGTTVVLHHTTQLDGKTISRNTSRHQADDAHRGRNNIPI